MAYQPNEADIPEAYYAGCAGLVLVYLSAMDLLPIVFIIALLMEKKPLAAVLIFVAYITWIIISEVVGKAPILRLTWDYFRAVLKEPEEENQNATG